MKRILSKYNILLDSLSKTIFFKIIFVFSLLIALYGFLCGSVEFNDFIICILLPYSNIYFNMFLFLILFLNSINIYFVIRKNYNYLIRLENRDNYLKNLICFNLIFNALWSLIIFLLILSFNILFRLEVFNISSSFGDYNISNIVYGFFFMFRHYMFSLLILTIFILCLVKYKEKISYIIMLLFVFGFFVIDFSIENKLFIFLPWRYFSLISFSSFKMEISCSLLFLIILEVVLIILYNIRQNKFKIKEVYFLLNDFEYLIKKNKILLLIFFLVPLLITFISNSSLVNGKYIFQTSLGLNIENENRNILSILWYCINIFSCIYIFINSFIKDYSNLANIYLRYNYKRYFFIKSLVNIILISLLKIVQYFSVYVIVDFIMKKECGEILYLFINDLSLILCLSFLVLLLYVIYKVFSKFKLFVGIFIIVCFCIFIINPLDISKINYIYFDVGIICIILILNYIIVKKNKMVIQEIGGI